MATWPTTLPATLVDGYTLNPQDQTIRTDMESGNARVRRRSAARVDTVDAGWLFSQSQMLIFRAWFENNSTGAAGGAAWFSIDLPTGTGAVASISARFSGAFSAVLVSSTTWKVSAKLETRT